ncbi:MAG TPA: helix-turn-helix transcriptional regulator [bacterium]|nr:helix-turn-helix transcriptional regulator [bacterium]
MAGHTFGRYVRRKRIEAGISLRDAAKRIGITHVYLGEVERGVRPPLQQKRWAALASAIPGIELSELERNAQVHGFQLQLEDQAPQYQDLALALARRIEKADLSPEEIEQIGKILREGKK